ncbi:hypothetical protein F5Y08DRAFT_301908 [Xylaria arbuscula]|nr:hypothetical protein F5Y08DRAFT_301908 [Xylaria arbuscula]
MLGFLAAILAVEGLLQHAVFQRDTREYLFDLPYLLIDSLVSSVITTIPANTVTQVQDRVTLMSLYGDTNGQSPTPCIMPQKLYALTP